MGRRSETPASDFASDEPPRATVRPEQGDTVTAQSETPKDEKPETDEAKTEIEAGDVADDLADFA